MNLGFLFCVPQGYIIGYFDRHVTIHVNISSGFFRETLVLVSRAGWHLIKETEHGVPFCQRIV